MSITIKPNTYYKRYYNINEYNIIYTDNKWVYIIAYKLGNQPLVKYDKKRGWGTIKRYQEFINDKNYKIEELSKEDLFLELL